MTLRELLLCSVVSSGAFAIGLPSYAQGDDDEETILDSVTVVAQKRAEDIQDVPISVTAYTDRFREMSGIISTQDQMNFAPGVTYSATADRVAIRGVGRQTNQLGTDPGVAVYQDGFYVPTLAGVGSSTLGTERVEILRGPQGTLYGRNSIGGAVNVISRRPSEDVEAEARIGANSYNRLTIEGRVAGPLSKSVSGSLLGIKVDQDDGYFENVAGGPDEGGVVDSLGLEAQLKFDPGNRIDGWLRWSFNEYDNSDRAENMISPYDLRYHLGSVPNTLFGYTEINPGIADVRKFGANRTSRQKLDDNHQIITEWTYAAGAFDVKYIGGYLTYDSFTETDGDRTARSTPFAYPVDFGWNALTLTTAVPDTAVDGRFDSIPGNATFDGVTITASGDAVIGTVEDKEAWSQEINISSSGSGPLQWLLGAYYYDEDIEQGFNLSLPNDAPTFAPYSSAFNPLFLNIAEGALMLPDGTLYNSVGSAIVLLGIPSDTAPNPRGDVFSYDTNLQTKSSAVFAQFDYDFSSQWHGTAGIRYTHDEKVGFEAQRIPGWYPYGIEAGTVVDLDGAGPGAPFALTDPLVVNLSYDLGPAPRTVEDSWNMVTGTAGLQWTPSDETMVYFNYSRGAKSGGFNLGTFALEPVDVETIDAFELGWKQQFGDSFILNSALYRYMYDGMQLQNIFSPSPGIQVPVLVNMDEVTSTGLELEARWAVTPAFQVLANYTYLDAEITNGCCFIDDANPFGALYNPNIVSVDANFNALQRLDGNQVPFSPEQQVAINATYTMEFGSGDLSLSLTGNHKSDSFYTVFNTPDYAIDGASTLDFRATWRSRSDRYAIIAGVTNLTDEEVVQSFTTSSPQASRQAIVGLQPPRIFQVELQARF